MHNKLAALALLTAAACVGTSAQAKDLTGWFINGGVGSAHYKATYEGLSGNESVTHIGSSADPRAAGRRLFSILQGTAAGCSPGLAKVRMISLWRHGETAP